MPERRPSYLLVDAVLRRVVVQAALGGGIVVVHARLTGPVDPRVSRLANEGRAAALYLLLLAIFVPVGWLQIRRLFAPELVWLDEDRDPDDDERRQLLSMPWRMVRWSMWMWILLAAITAVVGLGSVSPLRSAVVNGMSVLLVGLITSALAYLVAEQVGQPVLARALGGRAPEGSVFGPSLRLRVAWGLGAALPLTVIALTPLLRAPLAGFPLAVPVVFTAVAALVLSARLMRDVGRSIVRPLEALRAGMAQVAGGDLETVVVVDDGGELGQLQAGFNEMVTGLREREHLEDLFGRQVGEAVARRAMEAGVELGGELRDVSVLFVDLTASTVMAQEMSPDDVVAVLNRFFTAVVSEAGVEGGWVNKFEGDGAMCVFGAPEAMDDHPVRALRSARALAARLDGLGIRAGIGVSSGKVVAGNVGDESRYEYTVIGMPVNQASRLTDAAKGAGVTALADAATVAAAGDNEWEHWSAMGPIDLPGIGPVEVCRPR